MDRSTHPPVGREPRRARAWRLLTTRGLLAVIICPLCASLVLDAGRAQHERDHASARRDW